MDQAWKPDCRNIATWKSIEKSNEILGAQRGPIDRECINDCARRLSRLVVEMRKPWPGLDKEVPGQLTDWLIAVLIARENALLVGPPGVAKSQIAIHLLKLLGLEQPDIDPEDAAFQKQMKGVFAAENALESMEILRNLYKGRQMYFHYLLSRFTQPEELFGPVEIDLLKRGILARMNTGLMTAPGVRAAFLDEVFKASSSILNTLLTLMQERHFFNWGGMVASDLIFIIGASNEMPGGLTTSAYGVGAGGEEFHALYAFLDRFAARFHIPGVDAEESFTSSGRKGSDFASAVEKSIQNDAEQFAKGGDLAAREQERLRTTDMPVINDLLLLGRAMLQDRTHSVNSIFHKAELDKFTNTFYDIAGALSKTRTRPSEAVITWSISPRKLKAVYKIALAHALVRQHDELADGGDVVLLPEDLRAFMLIWDSPREREKLRATVDNIKPTLSEKW